MIRPRTIARARAGVPGGPFRRVLVAWDGSPDSVAALTAAAALVSGWSGHVVALTVLPEPAHVEGGGSQADAEPGEADRVRQDFARARAALQATSRARIDLHTAAGRQVARSLCGYATEHGFDLLVLAGTAMAACCTHGSAGSRRRRPRPARSPSSWLAPADRCTSKTGQRDEARVPPDLIRPVPLTRELVADLYWRCGIGLHHIELLTGQPAHTVRGFMRRARIPVRHPGGRSPFLRRWRAGTRYETSVRGPVSCG